MAESRLIQKQLAGKEDLLLGVGTVSQARATGVKTITKLNATHFGGVLVVDTINDLNTLDKNQLDEQVVLVKENGHTYIYNGTSWVTKTTAVVENIDGLKTLSAGTIEVLGYYTKGDGGGGLFYWDSTSTEADNGGTIIQAAGITTGRWKRVYSGDVNVKWFGAKGDGINDDTIYIQKALDFDNVFFSNGIYYITTELMINRNNVSINGEGNSTYIKIIDGSYSIFYAYQKSGIAIQNLNFTTQNQTNATAYKGFIFLNDCRNCKIINNSFFHFGHRAIYLLNTSGCIISNNYISTAFGAIQDSADIALLENSSYNIIDSNQCNGIGSDVGIFIQDPYTSTKPIGNIVTNNQVSEHNAYGIMIYVTTDYDSKTVIKNNNIRDIKGSQLLGASGAGIYVQRAGGVIVEGNTISNCCLLTTNFEVLGMGCIAVTGPISSNILYPVNVVNNNITVTRGTGIYCATGSWMVNIIGNTIQNLGTALVRCESIRCTNIKYLNITNNFIEHRATNNSALVVAATEYQTLSLNVSDNIVNVLSGVDGVFIYGIRTSGGYINRLVCSGNTIDCVSGVPLYISQIEVSIVNNCLTKTSGIAVYLDKLNNCKVDNCYFKGASAYLVAPGSNNIISETVNFDVAYLENNIGAGFIIKQYGDYAPSQSGLWDVGSQILKKTPVVGQPKGWRCTAGGNPGTWVSEGNL